MFWENEEEEEGIKKKTPQAYTDRGQEGISFFKIYKDVYHRT
jgi:hypothetical protein